MKILALSLLFVSISLYSQNRLDLNLGYGYYAINSENSIKIMGDKKFTAYQFYGLSYQVENFWGFDFEIEYNYHKVVQENTIMFIVNVCDICESKSFGGDVALINHSFDLNFFGEFGNFFSYGIGPSFIITNRIVEVKGIWPEYKSPILYDKLASSGLGVNGHLGIRIPFSKEKKHLYFTAKFKLRYTYSIWFDVGIRKLDDYNQEFLTGNLSMGIGYLF